MATFKEYFKGFTPGAQLVVVFMVIMAGSLFLMLLSGKSSPAQKSVSAESAQNTIRAQLEDDAIGLCDGLVSRSATNRSSVKFLPTYPMPRIYQDGAGRFMVNTRFSAKNGFGSESITVAKCVVSSDASSVLDMTLQDSR